MDNITKFLISAGVIFILCGIVWHFTGGKIPLGKLPGDIRIESEKSNFYFPITTCLIISGILSLLSWLIKHFK